VSEPASPYWSAAIAPSPRVENRFLRGWNYPHIPKTEPQDVLGLPDGGIEATVDVMNYHEIWRFHTDGLFTHRWRMREEGTGFRGTIHFVAAIYSVVEVFEFGRRLYGDYDANTDAVVFRVGLQNVFGLTGSGDSLDDLPYGIESRRNEATFTTTLSRTDLSGGILAPVVEATSSLFSQIGFSAVSDSFIERKAEAFLEGRI
jgi:hypothetical protein